jgi:8-amino-7-oxononanoate synthase
MASSRLKTEISKYEAIERELNEIMHRQLLRRPQLLDGPVGPWAHLNGHKILLLCSNDYLGLADHPSVKRAAKKAVDMYGAGAGASRLVAGTLPVHVELERALAKLKKTEAAIVFGSGYLANLGVISSICRSGDTVFSDHLNHASIIDACRLSRADVKVYPHRDTDALRRQLKEHTAIGRKLIVTDGVFSMDGDIAPLPELATLASEFDCYLMVDDAHATGVLGKDWSGTASYFGLKSVDIQMGTLSKALGSYGAFVAGSRVLIDLLVNRARSFIYTTALPPASAAAAREALRVIAREPERPERLWENAHVLKVGLLATGFTIGSTQTFILPVIIGDERPCLEMAGALLDEGVFAQAIRPPSVPEGTSRLRVVPSAEHENSDMEFAVNAFERAGRKCGVL